MTREIKFRVWDLLAKRMVKAHPASAMWALTQPDDFKLMQYTGIKDLEGREIYEGDIMQTLYKIILEDGSLVSAKAKVVFINAAFGIEWVAPCYAADFGHFDTFASRTNMVLSVAGNIYENPELLK